MAVLTPLVLEVDNARPVLFIENYLLVEETQRGADGQYVYRADIDCRAEVDF